jgi:hypothetical protein
MGYRTYIASIPKREYNKIKLMSEEELRLFYNIEKEEDDSWYMGVYEFGEKLYEFGKDTDFKPPKKSFKPFFNNKELLKRYSEYEFYVIKKEFLEYIINSYEERIKKYYNEMVNPLFGLNEFGTQIESDLISSIKVNYKYPKNDYVFDFSNISQKQQNALYEMINHVKNMRVEWVHLNTFNLNDGKQIITDSWKYEYSIFELVRIYKNFDWKKNVMFYYGY